MHSAIFEITEAENIKDYEFELCESSLYDELGRHGFDYVSEKTNRKEDIEWLFGFLEEMPYIKCGKDNSGYFIEIMSTAKKELTKEIWAELNKIYKEHEEAVKNNADDISEGMVLYKMKKAIGNEYSFRFWEQGILNTFQSLITDYKAGKFYIGNTLDYHY